MSALREHGVPVLPIWLKMQTAPKETAMRILAFETSGYAGSVAAARDRTILGSLTLPENVGSAASLAPAIHRLLREQEWRAAEIDLIALTIGPGSFTGLRVGLATAKALALAAGCPIAGIDTHDVLCWQSAHAFPETLANGRLFTAIDAFRSEVFSACFRAHEIEAAAKGNESPEDSLAWMRLDTPPKLSASDWLQSLAPGDRVVGPLLEKLGSQIPQGVSIPAKEFWRPQAISVAKLGLQAALSGRTSGWNELSPAYGRESAAEEKRLRSAPS